MAPELPVGVVADRDGMKRSSWHENDLPGRDDILVVDLNPALLPV